MVSNKCASGFTKAKHRTDQPFDFRLHPIDFDVYFLRLKMTKTG